jgi:hypothetical protein
MERDGLAVLARQLRAEPPAAVSGLAEEHLTHLAGAVQAARRRQAEQLQGASDQALEHIPRLLRGPIKKMVG